MLHYPCDRQINKHRHVGIVITVHNIGPILTAINLNSAVKGIELTLRTARMQAIMQNTEYRVSFNTGNETYQLQKDDAGTWTNVNALKTLPTGIDLTNVTATPVFQPLGTAPGGSTITLNNALNQQKQIKVYLAGQIQLQ